MNINNYTILEYFTNNSKDKHEQWQLDYLKDSLKQFNIFAFILYNPERDKIIRETLFENFSLLDRITGENLLFFGLAEPPDEWTKVASQRAYYALFKKFSESVTGCDPVLTLYNIAKSLEIPFESLPCIFFFNKYDLKKGAYISFQPIELMGILCELGNLANKNIQVSEIQAIKGKPVVARFAKNNILTNSMPTISAAYYGIDQNAKRMLVHHLNEMERSVETLRNTIKRLEINTDEWKDVEDQIEVLLQILFDLHSLRYSESTDNDQMIFDHTVLLDQVKFLEESSYFCYRSLLHWIKYTTSITHIEKFDFSPGIVSIAKMIEMELNFSFVHWIRSTLGVKLPQYFYKYQEGIECKIDEIDFNFSRNGKVWLPPPLGTSKDKILQLIKKKDITEKELCDNETSTIQSILKKLQTIIELRNKAAHDQVLNRTQWINTLNCLNDFASSNGFEMFYKIKKRYKPENFFFSIKSHTASISI